jgi:peptidyl-prolyl cis-trans isomerase SurA
MTQTFRRRATTLSLAAMLAAVGGLGVHGVVRAEIIEQILFKVNGEIFTKTELEARQVAMLRQIGRDVDPSTALGDAQLRGMLDEVTPEIVVNVVDEMLLVQRGRDLGYKISDEQFTGYLENIRKDNNLVDDEQFQAALAQEGMTLEELRRNIERQVIVSRVQQNEVMAGIAVSEEEARRYYDAHVAEFTKPQSVTLREILVSRPEQETAANAALAAAALAKAQEVHKRLAAGESFEQIASELSEAPSRANAGLVGPLSLGDLSAELRSLIGTMRAGDITAILTSPRGYQILKLEALTTAETQAFEAARTQITERIMTEKRDAEFLKLLDRLRGEAILEWKSAELEKAYDRGLEQRRAGKSVLP